MRTFRSVIGAMALGFAAGVAPGAALALDGTPSPATTLSPGEALRTATEQLRAGDKIQAVTSLQYAAEHGNSVALWQLGRMYAEGDGVKRDALRAFEYFRKFADGHADDSPLLPRSRFVADAFVSLGDYYLNGIPNSAVTPNPDRARRMFYHAASYFGDPEAQYRLATLYIDGVGVSHDAKRAVPWLVLAANKGHYKSQAMLGRILFRGEHGIRQPASGLMWLTVACDGPGGKVAWIADLRENAFRQATENERAAALAMLERWVEGRR